MKEKKENETRQKFHIFSWLHEFCIYDFYRTKLRWQGIGTIFYYKWIEPYYFRGLSVILLVASFTLTGNSLTGLPHDLKVERIRNGWNQLELIILNWNNQLFRKI